MTGQIQVCSFQKEDALLWQSYLERAPEGTVYHSLSWRDLLCAEYGFEPAYLLARTATGLCGIMPLVFIANLTGRKYVSLPASMYGGPLADTPEIAAALLVRAQEIARVRKASVRVVTSERLSVPGWEPVTGELDAVLSLSGTEREDWLQGMDDSVRSGIRKAAAAGLQVAVGTGALVQQFYGLYGAFRARLGQPAARAVYFRRLLEVLKGGVVVISRGTQPVAAALFLEDACSLYYALGVSSEEGRRLGAADRYLFELIRYAQARGKRRVFLGGSAAAQEGLRHFKAKWGARERQLFEYRYPVRADGHARLKEHGIPGWGALPSWVRGQAGRALVRWFY